MKFFDLEMDNRLARLITVYTKPKPDGTCMIKDQEWNEHIMEDCHKDGIVYSNPTVPKCKKYL